MAKIKKEDSEEIPKPEQDIRVEKPKFKNTLVSILNKKVDPNDSTKNKKD